MASARSSSLSSISLCAILTTFALIAATIVIALIPVYLPTREIENIASEDGTSLTVGYASDASNGGSDTISDESSVRSQLASELGTSSDLDVTGAGFIPTTSESRRKRQSFNSEGKVSCETSTGLSGDILVVPTQLAYPIDCRRFCRTRFRNKALEKLRKNYQKFVVTILFTILGSKQVTLVFCCIFDSDSFDCTTKTRNYAYLMDMSSILYRFNPNSFELTEIGSLNCATSSSLYSIALQRNGILWAAFDDGSLFRYNLISKVCTPTLFASNQSGFAPYTITFLKSTIDSSETLCASHESDNSTTLATIDTSTYTLSIVGTYNYGSYNGSNSTNSSSSFQLAGLNDGRLFGLLDAKPYTIVQIDPTTVNVLAQYPLNRSSTNDDPNYGFTVFNTRFFIFEGNGTYSDLLTYDLSSNTTTFQYTIPQIISGATSSSCLGA